MRVFNALAIKAPGFGDWRKAMLQDITVLTGSQVITEEMGRKLETTQTADLGKAVNAGKDGAVIVDNVCRQQKEQDDAKVGYDVLREVYVNMVRQGIIDRV